MVTYARRQTRTKTEREIKSKEKRQLEEKVKRSGVYFAKFDKDIILNRIVELLFKKKTFREFKIFYFSYS